VTILVHSSTEKLDLSHAGHEIASQQTMSSTQQTMSSCRAPKPICRRACCEKEAKENDNLESKCKELFIAYDLVRACVRAHKRVYEFFLVYRL